MTSTLDAALKAAALLRSQGFSGKATATPSGVVTKTQPTNKAPTKASN